MLWLDQIAPVQLPTPELAVALSEMAVPPLTAPARAQSSFPLVDSPSARENELQSATQDTPTNPLQNNIAELGEQQRRNHLQSLLLAAFETQFVYPALARRQGWQGRVRVALRVEADGRFSQLRVLRSSGYASLDRDALETLERIGQLAQARLWLDGRAMQVELPVVYRLLES